MRKFIVTVSVEIQAESMDEAEFIVVENIIDQLSAQGLPSEWLTIAPTS